MDVRTRWAERENTRRRMAYESAITRWSLVDGELSAMVRAARGFDGMPPQEAPPWLDLRRDEHLLWLGQDAQLVEAPVWPPLGQPGHGTLTIDRLVGPFDHAVPSTLATVDRGPIAVTDKRVVLAGRRRREWVYGKLAGLEHLPNSPCTLMFVTNRAKVSGVVLHPALAAPFRFNLALGLASGAGDRAGFVAHMERQLAWHQGIKPLPMAPVGAADAPPAAMLALDFLKTAVIGPAGASAGRRAVHLGSTFVVLLVLLALLTPGGTGNDQNTSLTSDTGPTAEATPTPSKPAEPSPTPTSPSPTPTPTPVVVKRTETVTEPVAFRTRRVQDPALDKGDEVVRTEGVEGVRTISYKVTYVDGKQTAKEKVSSKLTRQPVDKVVAVGTKEPEPEPEPEPESDCHPSYSGACVPIASDVDCAGGTGDGPAYVKGPVYVIGDDEYDLDRNNDGVACE